MLTSPAQQWAEHTADSTMQCARVCSTMQCARVCSIMQCMCSLSLVSIESTECLQPKTTATVGAHKGYCKRCGAVGWMVSKKYIHRYSQ